MRYGEKTPASGATSVRPASRVLHEQTSQDEEGCMEEMAPTGGTGVQRRPHLPRFMHCGLLLQCRRGRAGGRRDARDAGEWMDDLRPGHALTPPPRQTAQPWPGRAGRGRAAALSCGFHPAAAAGPMSPASTRPAAAAPSRALDAAVAAALPSRRACVSAQDVPARRHAPRAARPGGGGSCVGLPPLLVEEERP